MDISALHLEPGDVILVTYDPDDPSSRDSMKRTISDLMRVKSLTGMHYIVRVPKGVSVKSLSEEEMSRAGWVLNPRDDLTVDAAAKDSRLGMARGVR
jgi:hypothetical protein